MIASRLRTSLVLGLLLAAFAAGTATASDDWPEHECTAISEDAISWSGYIDLVHATDAAMVAEIAQRAICRKIEIAPIGIVDPFVFEDPVTCAIEVEECAMEVEGLPLGGGIVAAGGAGGIATSVTPGLGATCVAAATAVELAEKGESLMDAYLGCWEQGTAIANNERLTVIRSQVEEVQGKIDILKRLVVEGALGLRGSLRMASLYLPESQAGALELVRDYTRDAITQTAASGYILKPDIAANMGEAEALQAAGEYKAAFDLYRRAYRHTTAKSTKR
ncbi:MAG: hypothetical protein ABGY42_04925 [bacterium]